MIRKIFLIVLILISVFSYANIDSTHINNEKYDPIPVIMHHIKDAHEWHIGGSISIPLPIILWTDNGLVTFMSSEFHHDDEAKHIVERKGLKFVKTHEKIYYANSEAHDGHYVTHNDKNEVTNIKPYDFSITKNVFFIFLSMIILLLVFITVAKSYKIKEIGKRKLSAWMEPMIVFIRDEVALPNIGKKKYKNYVPFLLSIFFFIWCLNLLGLLPSGANVTGNIAVTLVLATISLFVIVFSGNKYYWGHIFNPPVPGFVKPIMILVEIIGIFTKPFALMIRLFANITAGHIVILSLISLIFIFKTIWISPISVAFSLFISVLELLVAILQAYVFTFLTALFIGMAVEEHH